MGELKIVPLNGSEHQETIHINKRKKTIYACLQSYNYIDKETNQHISYLPALEISGYGSTHTESIEMMRFSLEEYFELLLSMSDSKIQIELSSLGWAHSKIKNKDYSKTYIDISGNLKGFALNENVEQELLQVS